MPRVLAIYYMTSIVFFSKTDNNKTKRHNLLFIENSKNPYKLENILICRLNNIHILLFSL